jgi:hypothetical protein
MWCGLLWTLCFNWKLGHVLLWSDPWR